MSNIKDPLSIIRTAYWNKLSNYNRYAGKALQGVAKPYIIINAERAFHDPYKQSIVFNEVTVNLDIISDYDGYKIVDSIGQEILNNILQNGKLTFDIPDFEVMGVRYSSQSFPIEEYPTGIMSRKIISFYHNLRQL